MKLFSVAIGEQYEKEAVRLQRTVNLPIEVFTKSNDKYVEVNPDPLINGLWHKCNFANYIDEADGAVMFMDADMFTLTENPFSSFKIKKSTDIAFVPYKGKWHFPDQVRQEAFNHFGYKINSGFMWFKNLQIAQQVCSEWANAYLDRVALYETAPNITKSEYDEYALMIALKDMDLTIQLLNSKWNDWELETEEEIKSSNSIFFQSHNFLEIDINNQG